MAEALQSSMSRGEVSPEFYGRVDLPQYQIALRKLVNCFVRPTGGVSNRAGTQYLFVSSSVGDFSAVLAAFVYSIDIAYLLEFSAGNITIALNGEVIATVATPYSATDVLDLRYTQSADVLTVVHPQYPPHELRRLTSSSFEFVEIEFDSGPFLDENVDDTLFVHSSGVYGNVTITATGDIFTSDMVGSLMRLETFDQSTIKPWESGGILAQDLDNVFGLLRRSDGKVYRSVTDGAAASGETYYAGTIAPTHTEGVRPDGSLLESDGNPTGVQWEYLHSDFGVVRITGYVSATSVNAEVISTLPDAVVGGAITANGPWSMVGNGSTSTLATAGATSRNRNDYEVTFDGVIQETLTFDINNTADTVTFFDAPDAGVDVQVRQLSQNNRTTIWSLGAWSEDQGYPSVVTYYQDRLVFAATPSQPQTEWASRTAKYNEFDRSVPVVDSDPITQTLNARQINSIRELVPLDQLISITATASWATPQRGQAWTPETIGFSPQSFFGCAPIRSVQTGDAALFVENHQTRIRDLQYQFESDKFAGNDLTVFSRHLFSRTNSIVDMDYQNEPHGILWVVRLDGTLASCTYLKEQQVIGWARHETDGFVERVCCLPENGGDALYLLVRRGTARHVERMSVRDQDDWLSVPYLDSSLSYDGRNTGATTLRILGSTYAANETVSVIASAAVFSGVSDEGDELRFPYDDGTLRVRIDDYVSTTQITGKLIGPAPSELQNTATTDWGLARDTFAGLGHLEGVTVGVQVDGSVAADYVVTSASITLPIPGLVVHIGRRYVADIETLDVTAQGARMLAKNIPKVALHIQDTATFKAGRTFADEDLMQYASRTDENYEDPTLLTTDVTAPLYIPSAWGTGRVCIRQDEPAPLNVLSIIPELNVGSSG